MFWRGLAPRLSQNSRRVWRSGGLQRWHRLLPREGSGSRVLLLPFLDVAQPCEHGVLRPRLRGKRDPLVATGVAQAYGGKAAIAQAHAKMVFGQRVFAVVVAPGEVRLVEVLGRDLVHGVEDAAVGKEMAERIHFFAVRLGGLVDFRGYGQSLLLPGQTAPDGPGENAREFRLEPGREGLILRRVGDSHHKRDQAQTPPDARVGAFNDRLMIRREKNLVRRPELPEILMHALSPNGVTARGLLDKDFIEALAFRR